MIFDRTMLAYMDEQGEMGLLEPISILFLSKLDMNFDYLFRSSYMPV